MNSGNDEYLVKIETLQTSNFKALFGILKENNMAEANIIITPEGIEVLEMDPTHVVFVHIKLSADKFDSYYCQKPIKIGVDTVNLTKILKGVGNKDILTLFVKDPQRNINDFNTDDTDIGVSFGLLVENPTKAQTNEVCVDTMDVNTTQIAPPDLNYPFYIQLPSSDLQSIINSIKNIGADTVKLLFHKDTLNFYAKGDIGSMSITRARSNKEESSIKFQKNADMPEESGIIEIYVKLEKMVELTKCSCLSPIATIYLRNDYPIILEYDVGSLGLIRIGVSPHTKPDNY